LLQRRHQAPAPTTTESAQRATITGRSCDADGFGALVLLATPDFLSDLLIDPSTAAGQARRCIA
jgi:hypothetical protein